MRVLAVFVAAAFVGLALPVAAASAAVPGGVAVDAASRLNAPVIQADWNGGWDHDEHHEWYRHRDDEWRGQWRPERHSYWHRDRDDHDARRRFDAD